MELTNHTTPETEVALLYPLFSFLMFKIAPVSSPSLSPEDHNIIPALTNECGKRDNTHFISSSSGVQQTSLVFHSIPSYAIFQDYFPKVLFSSFPHA